MVHFTSYIIAHNIPKSQVFSALFYIAFKQIKKHPRVL